MSEFKTVEKDGIHYIICPAEIDAQASPLDPLVKSWLLSPAMIHLVDFKAVKEIRPNAYRAFISLNQQLKVNKKSLFSMNVPNPIMNQFRQDGLTSVFAVVANVDEARKRAGPRTTLDVEFINPFLIAAKNVIETQANLPLTPGKPYLKKGDHETPIEIAGVIALSAKEFTGSISLCFPAKVFLRIYEGLTGEKWETITPEIEDAAGEILNIVFGQAKSILNEKKGYAFNSALPTVLVGDRLKLHHSSRNPAIIVPFESPGVGAFHLEILIDKG